MTRDEEAIQFAKSMGIDNKEVEQFVENTKKFSDILPAFVVPETGQKVYAVFESDEIRENIDTDFGKSSLTTVVDDDGIRYAFWIRPGSMAAREYTRQRILLGKQQNKQIGSIAGKRYAFWKDSIQTKKFGEQFATRMQQVDKIAEETSEEQKMGVEQ